jgi:hypothetical protein
MKLFVKTLIALCFYTSAVKAADIKYSTNLAPSAQLHYEVTAEYSGFPLNGEAVIRWKVNGAPPKQTYSVSTETRSALLGKILEVSSVGQIDAFGLAPHKYEEKSFRKAAFQTTFDRNAKKIIFSESDQTAPLRNGEQDRSSAVWQLVSIARAATKKFVPKSQWRFFVAGRRNAEQWAFKVGENVKLATPLGNLSAVHVSKTLGDQRIDIWLAPTLEWYPVRIQFHDANGDMIEQNLVRIGKST